MGSELTSQQLRPIAQLRRTRTQQAFIRAQKQSSTVNDLTKAVSSTNAQIGSLEQQLVNQRRDRVEQLGREKSGRSAHDLKQYDDHIGAIQVQIQTARTQLKSRQGELTAATDELDELRKAHSRLQARSEQLDTQLRVHRVRESITRQQRIEIQSDEQRAATRAVTSKLNGASI